MKLPELKIGSPAHFEFLKTFGDEDGTHKPGDRVKLIYSAEVEGLMDVGVVKQIESYEKDSEFDDMIAGIEAKLVKVATTAFQKGIVKAADGLEFAQPKDHDKEKYTIGEYVKSMLIKGGHCPATGINEEKLAMLTKAAAIDTPAAGGTLAGTVTAPFFERMKKPSSLYQYLDPIDLVGESLDIPYADDFDERIASAPGLQAHLRRETGIMTADDPSTGLMTLKPVEHYVYTTATNALLRASAGVLHKYLMTRGPDAMERKITRLMILGGGAPDIEGFVNAPGKKQVSRKTGELTTDFTAEDALAMSVGLNEAYTEDAIFLMNNTLYEKLLSQGLAFGTGGQATFLPPSGLSGKPYPTFHAHRIIRSGYCPAAATEGDVILWSPSGTVSAQGSQGIESAESIHILFNYGMMAFRWMLRLDVQSSFRSVITHDNAETSSHIVTLGAPA